MLKAYGVPFEREFRFCKTRRWRADFHIVGSMLLVEVEGGVWTGGRHTTGAGYSADLEKYNSAQLLGYRVLRYTTDMVSSGEAIMGILEAIQE